MIKAVCFDFDGTLAQFSGDFGELQSRFGRKLGLSQTEVEKLEHHRAQLERRDGPMTFCDTVQAAFGEVGFTQPDNLEGLAKETVAYYCAQMKVLPGALEALGLCQTHNLPTALITNGTSDMQRDAVQAVGLTDAFKRILVSGDADVAVRKPNPRIFQLACEALGTEPGETLMIGDNLEADVRGALACGMQAVHLGREAENGHQTLPDTRAFGAWLRARLEAAT